MARSCLFAVLILLSTADPAAAQPATWTGAVSTSWNTAGNWSPAGVPNSAGRTITFDATASGFVVNIGTSVTAGSLTFNNLGAGQSYALTSSAAQTLTLAGVTDILLTDAVIVPQTINLANVAAGSLLFTGTSTSSFFVRNLTTSTGTAMLVIGPNTRIAAVDTGGVFFDGTGHTLLSGNIVAAPAGLTKDGAGTLTLSGTNAFSGVTRLTGGLLALDYSTAASSKLPSGALQSAGGELSLLANATTAYIESALGTSLNAGHTTFRLSTNFGALADIDLSLGAISRQPTATADFRLDLSAGYSTTSGNVNGILSGALTADGASWATNSAGSVINLPIGSYSPTFAAGTNVNMTSDEGISTLSINSLRFGASGLTLSIIGNLTIQSGGILQSTSGGGGTTMQGGGTVLAPAGQPLLVHTYGSLPLTVSTRIDTADGLVKTGTGTLVLSGNNTTLTGAIDVNRGNLTVTTSSAVNSASALRFNDGRGDRDQFFTVEIAGDINTAISRPIQLRLDSAAFGTRFSTGANLNSRVTLSGVISSAVGGTPLKIGTTTSGPNNGFNLTGTNTFGGPVTLDAGFLGIDANASLGNAANTLILSVGSLTAGGLEFLNSGVIVSRPVQIDSATRILSNATDVNTISGIISDGNGSTGTLVKAGAGTLVLSGANTYTGSTRIDAGTLRVSSDGNLGAPTAELVISGGTLATTATFSVSAIRSIFLGLPDGGPGTGTIDVAAGTTLTVPGAVINSGGAFGGLVKSGPGTLVLTNATNSYSGGTTVQQGTLQVTSNFPLGAASGPVTVEPLGTLVFTSSTTTGRTFNLTSGTMEAPAGVTLTMSGATVGGGFLRGNGTYTLNGGTALTGVTTFTSTTMNVTGPASASNFSNNGAITVNSGQTFGMNYATNGAAGRITVNGTMNVNDFVSYGLLTVPNGGLINNTLSNMVLGGGSRTFVGAVGNLGGKIDLGGQQLLVAGGLLVTNAGTFASGNGVRNGTTVADYGALVKGTGPYQSVITQNGGQYLPGNSPGTSQVGDFFINGGGNLIFQITDAGPSLSFPGAPGIAGSNPGWGLTQVFTSMNFTATPASPYTITMQTQLPPPAAPDTPGLMSSFDANRAYQWLIFDLQPGAVFNGTFDPNAINFATAAFVNPTVGGTFSLTRNAGQIFLTFTPVPEPATVLALAFGGLVIGRTIRRRRRLASTV